MTQLRPGSQGQTSTWLSCDQDLKVKRPHDSVVTRIPRSNVHLTQLWPGSQSRTSTWCSCDQEPKDKKRPYDSALFMLMTMSSPFMWPWMKIHGHAFKRQINHVPDGNLSKWNESGFRPPLCTYRLNWARRTPWGWWDDWDDTVLQTQDSKFAPWRSEAEHATSRSRRPFKKSIMLCCYESLPGHATKNSTTSFIW